MKTVGCMEVRSKTMNKNPVLLPSELMFISPVNSCSISCTISMRISTEEKNVNNIAGSRLASFLDLQFLVSEN